MHMDSLANAFAAAIQNVWKRAKIKHLAPLHTCACRVKEIFTNLPKCQTLMRWFICNTYGKCSKNSNTYLYLFSNTMLVIMVGIHKMLVIIANREVPDQTASERSSLIWVCTVCLGLFDRQLVFEILEHLLYYI